MYLLTPEAETSSNKLTVQTHVVKNVRLIVCAASVSPASESSQYLERSLELHAKGRERAREARSLPLIRAFSPAFIAIRNGELGLIYFIA